MADLLQKVHIRRGLTATCFLAIGHAEIGPAAFQPVGLVRPVVPGGFEFLLQIVLELLDHPVAAALRDNAFVLKLPGVERTGCRLPGDGFVHQRLGEGWFVGFVMPGAAVTPEIEDHIALNR